MLDSAPPQLIETNLPPSVDGLLRPRCTGCESLLVDSISVMPQFGHVADTMSRSREISPAHPVCPVGIGLVTPFWFNFWKQPFAVVHAGRPYCERYTARSASAFGSSYASMM